MYIVGGASVHIKAIDSTPILLLFSMIAFIIVEDKLGLKASGSVSGNAEALSKVIIEREQSRENLCTNHEAIKYKSSYCPFRILVRILFPGPQS